MKRWQEMALAPLMRRAKINPMRSRFGTLACSLLFASSLTATSSDAADEERGCLTVRPNASFDGTGYAHYALLENGCQKRVRCELWTDVDPMPLSLSLASGDSGEITFRRGSPAYEFRAFARCSFR
jgi:hypothetical protein